MIDGKTVKILYIITRSNLGGAQVHLFDLISHLPKHIRAYIAIGEQGWLYDECEKQGITVYHVESLVRQISPIKDVQAVLQLKKIITEVQPNIVHCHSSKAGLLGRIAAKICGIPTIFTAHGWAFTEGVAPPKRFVYKLLENMAAQWTARIICVSEYDRKLGLTAMQDSADKLVTIHNGTTDVNEQDTQHHSIASDSLRLIMVARFISPKDHALLLRALAVLQTAGIRFTTTLVGDGPNLQACQQLAHELGISENVQFVGARSDVHRLLARQDIFVLTSNWEGFPISILEAMGHRLPIVASDVGGVHEAVIDGETGFLIPRGNVDCLVEALQELHNNAELRNRMGINGRQRFEDYFTVQSMVKKIVEVYEEVIGSSHEER